MNCSLERLRENFFLCFKAGSRNTKEFHFSFSCEGKQALFFSKNQWENPNDLHLKNSYAERDAMSYLECVRTRCEMSNKFAVKYFSHLTIVKISEFSHSPSGESKTSQKCYDKKGRGEKREA